MTGDTPRRPSWRGDKRTAAQRGYGYRWQKARAGFLGRPENTLCVMCRRAGRLTPATVVDHIEPHRGDYKLFWSRDNWQALCAPCHNGTKQASEGKRAVGVDGWPV